MFLALTSQTEFWDAGEEILFAGQWCARHDRRDDWKELRHRVLPSPWDDVDRYRRAVVYCAETVERLLGPLTEHLNEALSVRRSTHYWRILLGRWFAYHVQQMYDHYVIVEDAFATDPEIKTLRLDPASFVVPKDTLDFIQLSLKDAYHLQIFSPFLAARGRTLPMRRLHPENAPLVLVYPRKRGIVFLKRVLSRIFASIVPPGLGDVLVNELNLNRGERRKLFLGSRLKALPYLAELPPDMKFEPVWDKKREGLARIAEGRDAFERALIASLPHHFPTLYLEGYETARNFSLARLWRRPRVIFSAMGWDCSEAFKFAAAESAEHGSRVWSIQHGGFYGFAEHADAEDFERSIADRFYGWGWAELAKDPKVRNLPHPQLSRVGAPAPGDGILFTPIAMAFHHMRLGRNLVSSKLGNDYIERQARFLRALPEDLKKKTATRLHVDFGWRHQERLRELFPTLRVDDPTKSFPAQLRKARVAVFDCPMTTFLEAFAAGIPSVLSWSPNAWTFRPEARPFIDNLREAGILFDEPEAAARQVARVYGDPRAWWDSPAVRGAHQDFAAHFALSRADWLDLWLEEIRGTQ